MALAPDGSGILVTRVFQLNRPELTSVGSYILTIFDPSFTIRRQAVLSDVYEEACTVPGHSYWPNDAVSIGVTSSGEVVFATQQSRTFVVDSEAQRIATCDSARGGDKAVSIATGLPSGKLLCVRDDRMLCVSPAAGAVLATCAVRPRIVQKC